VETGHGTSGGSSVDPQTYRLTKPISSGVAYGFTQFIPETAAGYGLDDQLDARAYVQATAKKLCNDGIVTDPASALGRYNGGDRWASYAESRAYVAEVKRIAGSLPEDDGSPPGVNAAGGRSWRSIAARARAVAGWAGDEIILGWEKLGERLDGGPHEKWAEADAWLFATPASARLVGRSQVVDFARAQLGVPYVYGGASPDGWDCSGLTLAAYATVGVTLPHDAAAQARMGSPVKREDVRPGDLIFHFGDGVENGHVGIAVDSDRWIVAPHTGDVVKEAPIPWDRVTAIRRYGLVV